MNELIYCVLAAAGLMVLAPLLVLAVSALIEWLAGDNA